MRKKKRGTFPNRKLSPQELDEINRLCDRHFIEANVHIFEKQLIRLQSFSCIRGYPNFQQIEN